MGAKHSSDLCKLAGYTKEHKPGREKAQKRTMRDVTGVLRRIIPFTSLVECLICFNRFISFILSSLGLSSSDPTP